MKRENILENAKTGREIPCKIWNEVKKTDRAVMYKSRNMVCDGDDSTICLKLWTKNTLCLWIVLTCTLIL